ncbi:MAG: homogentisate 1,2-dioxygenase [Alphaproteobacteria bacterium]|nr:homogentisate 1,2-dioxygenase [Alphaproteobacteria bacterium]
MTGDLAGWTARKDFGPAGNSAVARRGELEIGEAVNASLLAAHGVVYLAKPGREGAPESKGGLFALSVTEPGIYGVALGAAAWIDVLRDGEPVQSTAHGHGPECSTIRKIVEFSLRPGDYVVQISGSPDANLPIMVIHRP